MYKYIEEKLVYYKELVNSMDDDINPDWAPLEDIFRKIHGTKTDVSMNPFVNEM